MKIAIVGAGRVGAGLARAWGRAAHDISLAIRDPSRVPAGSFTRDPNVSFVEISQAARDVDAIVLAVPYAAVDEVVFSLGALDGQIVIDCTNAVRSGLRLEFDSTTSAAEELQRQIPTARVFKSFNAQGAESLGNAEYHGIRATNFFCGDDAHARPTVAQLVQDAGFEPVYVGSLDKARHLESLMLLWAAVAQQRGTREVAFKLLERGHKSSNI